MSCIRVQDGAARDALRFHGGPGSGRVAKGWDVSATQNGTIVLVLLATGVGAIRRYHPRTECKSWLQGNVRACQVVRTL